MARTALISHQDCVKHENPAGHPERPERIGAILDELIAEGLFQMLPQFQALEATRDQLLLVHSADYVDGLIAQSPVSGTVQLDADAALNECTLRAARLAAGAGIKGVDLVTSDDFDNVFCCVRPPGHHAERARAMGFCVFGSVAIAALYALQKPAIKKVAIIDFDVHHGSGTEDLIADHDDIFFCSTFQHSLYPGKFGSNVEGRRLNLPLPEQSGGEAFKETIERNCLPALRRFAPDLILISAGFNAHADDRFGGLNLLEPDFAWATVELKKIAEEFSDKRMVSMLEGGYNLQALGCSTVAHVKALLV